jgi:aminoglycoside phosphotransferase (APT) family kinase protein
MRSEGRQIAKGRDGAIYEYGPGLVLRRTFDGRSLEGEARTMRYAAERGYPVPEVHDVLAGGTELVMERIEGPIMMDAMLKELWKVRSYANLLADLHDTLHAIPAPDWLPRLPDGGDRLVHLDLHPLNVIMAARGPVVIDWPNAAAGHGLSDVAATYVLLTCPQMPGPRLVQVAARPFRSALARAFVRRYRGRGLDATIATAADRKARDRNMTPEEVASCGRLATRMRRRATQSSH